MWEVSVGEKGLCFSESMDIKILTWNVRGLDNKDKRIAIRKGFCGQFQTF